MTAVSYLQTHDKAYCSGCGACAAVCPHQAITMQPDEKGFLYPVIDKAACIDCHLCERRCPYNRDLPAVPAQRYYAAWSLDDNTRNEASSGGIGAEMARLIIDQGGVCIGAVYEDDFTVAHRVIDKREDLHRLGTSKYSQSRLGDIYQKTRTLLEQDVLVCFFGTPCQVAGLQSFLNKPYDRLITCDLICGGVPSPLVFRRYLQELQAQYGARVSHINMKDKRHGWYSATLQVVFEDGQEFAPLLYKNPFGLLFSKQVITRESCRSCGYATLQRCGDITIGDYWGVKQRKPELYSDRGVSLMLTNTPTGQAFFEKLSASLATTALTKEDCLQPRLSGECVEVDKQKSRRFWKTFHKKVPLSDAFQRLYVPKENRLVKFARRCMSKMKRMFKIS